MRVVLTQAARAQVADAAHWYKGRDPSTVSRFRSRLRQVVARLQEHPEMGSAVGGTTYRRVLLTPFPYFLVYEIRDESVRILAVPHVRQSPQAWIDR